MKQTETTMKKIGGVKFYITPFPAFTAARISGELSKVLAPMLGSLAPLMNGVGDNASNVMDADVETMLPVLADALGQLSGDSFEHLMKELLVTYKNIAYDTEDDVEKLTYEAANEIFCGEIMDMLLLCWEVIKINFGGFFEKLAGQFGSLPGSTGITVKKSGTKNGGSST
ncbi:MAG: hypothetical protein LUD12_10220 [Lachnospiraceae bacterium]|nr:hypothetical protein [Lachnospiraceae bacterium]